MNCQRNCSRRSRGISLQATIGLVELALGTLVFGSTLEGCAAGHAQQLVTTKAEATAPATTASATIAPLVFDQVTVVDVERGVLVQDQRVVIVGNRIRTMGNVGNVQMPAGARVVDARGKYLIPGLWDMHTHQSHTIEFTYPLFIFNGVTGIRDAGSAVPLDTLNLWRREILAGSRVGPPRQLLSGPALDFDSACNRATYSRGPWTQHSCVASPADARHVVDSLKAAGADIIKTYNLTTETYFAIAAEARKIGIPFGGHIWDEGVTPIEASDSGARILDHAAAAELDTVCIPLSTDNNAVKHKADIEQCRLVTEHLKRNNTWWAPSLLGCPPGIKISPATWALRDRVVRLSNSFGHWDISHRDWIHDTAGGAQNAFVLPGADFMLFEHRLGSRVIVGTDAGGGYGPSGFLTHAEMAIFVKEGLTPLEALQAGTLNPVKAFNGTDSLGTVAPGKLADLVLLDADPLADITNTTAISGVVANGRYFDRAALDQLIIGLQARPDANTFKQ